MTPNIYSSVNSNVLITQSSWAVTLTCDSGNSFHARLIFEGLKDEHDLTSYFYRTAHLRGLKGYNPFKRDGCSFGKSGIGVVEISDEKGKKHFKAKFRAKTETWMVARHKIESLIKEIEKEHQRETPFQICGNKSIFAKQAEIFEIYDQLLGELYKKDPNLFLCLYDSAQNGGEYTGMNQLKFEHAISVVQASMDKLFITEELTYSNLIDRVLNFTKKLNSSQHSCFTWAREKLEKVDIKLEDNQLEGLISITTKYAKYTPGENISCKSCIIPKEERKVVKEEEVKNLYERFVTYNTARDRRTEDWKIIQQKSKYNHLLAGAAETVGYLGFTLTAPILLFSPVLLATAPIACISIAVLGIGSTVFNEVVHKVAEENQEELKKNIQFDKKLNQPGNRYGHLDTIRPSLSTLAKISIQQKALEPDSQPEY